MNLPAGLLPSDRNIEIFADPSQFGKCLFVQHGHTRAFYELPGTIIPSLYKECFSNKKAVKAMREMGINEIDMVEHYNYCNRGRLDSTPDISTTGKLTTEFVDCGRHGTCKGEGLVCNLMGLTFRELQCLRLNNNGKDYSQIKKEMGFKSQTAVNSLMSRLRDKLNAKDRTQLLMNSYKIGIL